MEASQHSSTEHPLNTSFRLHGSSPNESYGRSQLGSMDARQAIAIGLIALGMIGVLVAWFGISGTLDPGEQMPYLASGGIGGAALIAIGVTVYISWEHVQDRAALNVLLQRLDEVESTLRDLASPTFDERDGSPTMRPTNGTYKRSRALRAPRSSAP
jgi:hypothetical protein